MMFCLDDGAELLYGPALTDEPATAVFTVPPSGGSSNVSTAGQTEIYPAGWEAEPPNSVVDSTERRSLSAHRAAEPQEKSISDDRAAEPQEKSISDDRAAKPRKAFRKALAILGILAAILITAVFGFRYFYGNDRISSIAVLPFENRSGDPNSEYLSDGLAESLIYRLSRLPDLRVSPTSSVIRYKGKEANLNTIASDLGVEAVMTGRLTQIGDKLTISVELVQVQNNKLLWGEQYDRTMSDLLATQREIAAEIASKLQLKLSGDGEKALTKSYTVNNEAYQLYLKGRYHFARRSKPDVERSVEYFKQAIALDPNFALAYAAMADSYNGMTAYPYMAPKEAVPLAKAAANRALEIDPTLAEAHTALANSLACFDWNWKDSEREFKRAIELNPDDAGTHWRYGMFFLMPVGRLEEAVTEGKRSLDLEPLDLNHGANLSGLYFYARRYDEALEQARQVHGLDENFIVGRWALSQVSIEKGMYADVIELNEKALQSDPTNPVFLRFAGIAYAKAGRRNEAEKIIDSFRELAKTQYVMSYHLALIYSAMGDKEKALAELENAFNEHDYLLPRIKVEPFLDPLRDDPRFTAIVRRMGLPE